MIELTYFNNLICDAKSKNVFVTYDGGANCECAPCNGTPWTLAPPMIYTTA